MVASKFGGMDIETVAEQNPHAIVKVYLRKYIKLLNN